MVDFKGITSKRNNERLFLDLILQNNLKISRKENMDGYV